MKKIKRWKKAKGRRWRSAAALLMGLLAVVFYGVLTVKAEVNEYDFSRMIELHLNGGTSGSMYWQTEIDRSGLGWQAGTLLDSMGVGATVLDKTGAAHTVEAREGNECPREGVFYEHADFIGVTPYIYIREPVRDGWSFMGWDSNTAFERVQDGYWRFECGCYAAGSGDIYISALWKMSQQEPYGKITVNHYVCGIDGKYPQVPTKTEELVKMKCKSYKLAELKDSSLEVTKGIYYSYGKVGNRQAVSVGLYADHVSVDLYYERQRYMVTYNVAHNGGTWQNGSSQDKTEWVYYEAPVDLEKNSIKRGGWTQNGWNEKQDAIRGQDGEILMGKSDITLYASYSKPVEASFVDCKGSRSVSAMLYNNQSSAAVSVPDIRAYTDWKDVSGVRTVGYDSEPDICSVNVRNCRIKAGTKYVNISDNIVYYAVYAADAILSYNVNGGTENKSVQPVTAAVYCSASAPGKVLGQTVILGECSRPKINKDGYIHEYQFAVWAQNGEDGTRYPCNASCRIEKNTVMHALWQEDVNPITYYIVYDGNGNGVEGIMPAQKASYGEAVQLTLEKPVRTGFEFVSWNTRPGGDGTSFEAGETVTNLTSEDGSEIRLYAQWRQKQFQLVKASSSRYNAAFVRRTTGDESWYNNVGKLKASQLAVLQEEDCIQRWTIRRDGSVSRVK